MAFFFGICFLLYFFEVVGWSRYFLYMAIFAKRQRFISIMRLEVVEPEIRTTWKNSENNINCHFPRQVFPDRHTHHQVSLFKSWQRKNVSRKP